VNIETERHRNTSTAT